MKPTTLLLGALLSHAVAAIPTSSAQTNTITVQLNAREYSLLEKATDDTWFKMDTFVSTLLGGFLAIFAAWAAHKIQLKQQKTDDAEFVQRVLQAIRAEIAALQESYDRAMGAHLAKLKPGDRFNIRLGLSLSYFTVFEANAVHLGKLDPEVAKRVVRLYVNLKALVDNFRINNQYISDHEALLLRLKEYNDGELQKPLQARRPPPDYLTKRGFELERWMAATTDELRALDADVRVQYQELTAAIEKSATD